MTNEAENERVRGYLVAQAGRHDWPALWPRVVGPRTELLAEIASVSEEQASFKPAADDWSIRECVEHVLRVSRGTLALIEGLAEGKPPDQGAGAPSDRDGASLAELRARLAEHSSRYAGLLGRLPAAPDLELTAPHRLFGELNSRQWFLFQRLHDTDHLGQIRAVKEAAGYPER